MHALPLRARSVGEVLDAGFQLFRSGWTSMAAATLILVSPVLLLLLFVSAETSVFLGALANLFFLAASAATVLIASEAYHGRELSALPAVKQALRRFLSVWGAAIIQGFLIGLGVLLLIIPGVIAMALTFGIQPAVMVEGRSAGDAFTRSRKLAQDSLKHILAVIVVAFLMVGLATVAGGFLSGLLGLSGKVALLADYAVPVLANPLSACITTALYYDMRIRKEAYDMQVMTADLDEDDATQVQPAHTY